MKICFIAPANNYHTEKWCKWFVSRNHEVHVISFVNAQIVDVTVHFINAGVDVQENDVKKLKYLFYAKKLKRIVSEIKPDIINVHYATSYGTVTALSGIKGYVLSVWGSDIFDFPRKTPIHRLMLQYSLNKATYLFSTSKAMAKEAKRYTNKTFEITPFGVDMNLFSPHKRTRSDNVNFADSNFIIGTVKTLTPKYGIDYLLKAVAAVKKNRPEIPIKLRIAGSGPNEKEYKQLAVNLGIDDITTWLGFIPQSEVAKEWANMDLAVVYSTLESESFGVSAVEAEACGTPIIISDIPGLMEATLPGKSSLIVQRKDEQALAEAILELYDNNSWRKALGVFGRKYAVDNYDIDVCFSRVEHFFEKIRINYDT